VGAVGLLVVLFLRWYHFAAAARGNGDLIVSGWGSLGWFLDVLLALTIFGGIALTFTTVRRSAPAVPVGSAALTFAVGTITWIVLLVRIVLQPDLGTGDSQFVDAYVWPVVGLVLAALIPAGAFVALKDERTDAPESAYTPPPARPVPGG
jgi:hypothetical protein